MMSLETMTVRIVYRTRGTNYEPPLCKYIHIAAHCPACGQRRGTPELRRISADGLWVNCHVWSNPCGHVDQYVFLLAEAEVIKELRKANTRVDPCWRNQ